MKTTIVALIIGAIVFGQAWIINFQAGNNKQLIFDLNVSQTQVLIYKAQLKRVTEEKVGLREANECLIKYSSRDRCLTEAIKHTPLPKLLKEVK